MEQKKKADYTDSAVNLCNPPQLNSLLIQLQGLKKIEADTQTILDETTLYKQLTGIRNDIVFCLKSIREAIDAHGSYQDLDAGAYAVKQKRISITYVVSKVREFIRTYADAVIDEAVNKTKLEGLRKGGLVPQADLDRCADTTETFAYVIKTPEGA